MISEEVQAQFSGAPGYLNTGSIGLPPSQTVRALEAAIDEWQAGKALAPAYDAPVEAARQSFADLVAAPIESVAIGSQVSALVALVATVLQPGSRVLCPEGDFTSVIFPFLARADLSVELVPLEDLVSRITPDVDLVAFSAVQSADGRVADLAGIRTAAASAEALTMVDGTQAVGWLPLDSTEFDFTVTGTYKWLLCPRGTAFLTVRSELAERVVPLYAGWYAGEERWESIYGAPLRLAASARRFDLSPGWLAWVGTAQSLAFVAAVGVEAIQQHDLALANLLRERCGLEPTNSPIVALEVPHDFDATRLDGLSTAFRAGRLRVAFHLYNTTEDVTALLRAIRDEG